MKFKYLGMDNFFQLSLYWACDNLFMLELRLIHSESNRITDFVWFSVLIFLHAIEIHFAPNTRLGNFVHWMGYNLLQFVLLTNKIYGNSI